MGNASTKESRSGDGSHRSHHGASQPSVTGSLHADRSPGRRNRLSRGDLGVLGLVGGSSSHSEHHHERRETKQEREARRLERERVQRLAERERSMKEENVDGGFLVTMGTYVGVEDFNKQIVRQLQIERKIAPFWRGLNDLDDQWTEPQIIAAARGLPIPAADEVPPDELIPRPLSANDHTEGSRNINSLMVPIAGRTQSTTSEHSMSNPGSALPSPISSQPARTSSPFRPRGKALAAVLGGNSRNGSTTEIVPREINISNDPFVNGQPIEVFLYKNATECPICFLTYPPYLNQTRCCGQAICSECFVQIKRPDPHFPEGHNENDPNHNPEEAAGMLVSEPACCPYCTQPDFGVTYDPPPFRRGLAYSIAPAALSSMSTAMSSSSSVNSASLSPPAGAAGGGRRRTQSLSATSPNVILTDRIRPEWATKLQAARAHQARRAAAATALHTAAFMMGNTESRAFRSRFGRRNTGGSGSTGAPSGGQNNGEGDNGDSGSATPAGDADSSGQRGNRGGTSSIVVSPRMRAEELEEIMVMEAIRLSLAEEEERKRKEELEKAKQKTKEENKPTQVGGGPYDDGAGNSQASASSLSVERKRGNSASSNLRVEASVTNALATTAAAASGSAGDDNTKDKGKAVDRNTPITSDGSSATAASRPALATHQPAGPSHLSQMSSASSISSSILDSQPSSFTSPSTAQDPRGSGLSLESRSATEEGECQERGRDPSASTEPLLNFRSLAEVVGVSLEGENAGRRLSQIELEKSKLSEEPQQKATTTEQAGGNLLAEAAQNGAAQKQTGEEIERELLHLEAPSTSDPSLPPKVMVTPDTPAVEIGEDSKQLGYQTTTVERTHQLTQ
ncbi:SNF1-interacting protein [Podospora pseudopauciseta]|uniref:SNF1-interacting protein n=1 Tax=Podospora pseudopauciseta TaxID=2093780 RepID=A0ABR0HC37_9PEZI|nr:SNF1-interacting protein [Podospora pseudopauciseta]